jgi:hypothetical protein
VTAERLEAMLSKTDVEPVVCEPHPDYASAAADDLERRLQLLEPGVATARRTLPDRLA